MRFRLLSPGAALQELASWWNNNWRQAEDGLRKLESPTTGAVLLSGSADGTQAINKNTNASVNLAVVNANAGTAATAVLEVAADSADAAITAHALARTATRYGFAVGGYSELLGISGNGLLVGTLFSGPIIFGTNNVERFRIENSGVAFGAAGSYGGGAKVIYIANATTAPTTNPSGGGVLYCEGGALKFRGSGGTVTTIAPA